MSRTTATDQLHPNGPTSRRDSEGVRNDPRSHPSSIPRSVAATPGNPNNPPSPVVIRGTTEDELGEVGGGEGEEEEEEKEGEGGSRKAMTPSESNRAAFELQKGLLWMYRQQRLTDVSIKVGRAIFRCHKVVLCAMSTLFKRLLTEEPERRLVIFRNADAKVFEDVLEYIYTGHFALGDNFSEFINLVLKLEISSMQGKMDAFLEGNLTSDNCMSIWRYASSTPEMSGLGDKALGKLVSSFFEDGVTEQLEQLTVAELVYILEHDDLQVEMEDQVVRRAIQWLSTSQVRAAEAAGLFQRLRLPLCSLDFLRREVVSLPVIKESPACRDAVTEAMTFLSNPQRRHEFHSKRIAYRKCSPVAEVMLVFGGYKLSGKARESVALDLGGREWYNVPAIPQHPGKGLASCVYDNNVYVSGGSGDPEAFWIFLSKDCRWVQGPRLTEGRSKHCMEVLPDGTVCVIGGTVEVEVEKEEGKDDEGWDKEPEYEEEPVLEVETLKLSGLGGGGGGGGGGRIGGGEQWREAMELLIPIYEAASSVSPDGSKIFLYGGKMDQRRPTDSLQCLDLRARTCTLLSTGLPVACAGAEGLRTSDTFFLLSCKGEVMRFDPATAELRSISKLEYFNRKRFRMICHHDKLLVIGGEDGVVQKMMVCLHLDEPAVQLVPWENFMPPVRSHFGLAKVLLHRSFLGEPQWS